MTWPLHCSTQHSLLFSLLLCWVMSDGMVICNACLSSPGHGQLFDRDCTFAAAPDVFPPDKFNAGVLMIRPDEAVFLDMMSKLNTLGSYDGGDTGEICNSKI